MATIMIVVIVCLAVCSRNEDGETYLPANQDIMGFRDCYYKDNRMDEWIERTYYNGSGQIIGESFGFTIDDYGARQQDFIVDLNGDNKRELVCNCEFGGDGARRVYVFTKISDRILRGEVNLEALFPDADVSANALFTYYDDNSGDLIALCPEDPTDRVVHLGVDDLVFTEWNAER